MIHEVKRDSVLPPLDSVLSCPACGARSEKRLAGIEFRFSPTGRGHDGRFSVDLSAHDAVGRPWMLRTCQECGYEWAEDAKEGFLS